MTSRFLRRVLMFALSVIAAGPGLAVEDTDLADDEPSSTCQLEGISEGALTVFGEGEPNDADDAIEVCLYSKKKRLHCLTFKGTFNEAKQQVQCRGDTISIWTQQGFSAASVTYLLRFSKGKLSVVRQEKVDPSREAMEAYRKAIKKGKVQAAVIALDGVLYPDHYLDTKEICAELLTTGHRSVKAALKKKEWGAVVAGIKPAWDWCEGVDLAAKGGSGKAQKSLPLVLALNDYGFALVETGAFREGEATLKLVLDLDKDRTPAYLNLGDALQGQKKDPTSAYGEYCKRAPRSKWPKRLAQASAPCQ